MAENIVNESGGDPDAGPDGRAASKRRSWYADWRVWLGVSVTVVCVWYSIRGIPIDEVFVAMKKAHFGRLLIYSTPFYLLSIYLRALRWRHLTNSIQVIPRSVMYRSTAIGFMVNNLLPLRLGEFARSWTLAREAGVSVGSVLGTVVLERVLDVASVLLLAFGALAYVGMNSNVGGILQQGSMLLLPIGIAPLLGLIVLRLAPEQVIRFVLIIASPLPERHSRLVERALRSFVAGLGALSGGMHLFWIFLHSALIWLVASTGPLLLGLWAFDVDLGSAVDTLFASWILLGAVGVAVAIPSAPGFIGPYQLAFKAVLVRFGVDPATALAMGVLVWAVFWITLTLQGLFVLRGSHLKFSDLSGGQPEL